MRRLLVDGIDALYRFILVRVDGNTEKADDILQQTAFVALQHQNTPDDESKYEPWLRGIARNLIRRHWRDVGRNPVAISGNGSNGDSATDARSAESAAGGPMYDENKRALSAAIASLPADDQWVLYAFYRHSRSMEEIATESGVTVKSVESRLYRSRNRLREILASNEELL